MARAKGPAPLSLTITVEGARETLKAFKDLPKEASDALRTAALELSGDLAGRIAAAGRVEGRQARRVAGTVKAKRDRVPSVAIGPSPLLFGSEFGAVSNRPTRPKSPFGFLQHTGKAGRWIFPTVEANQGAISRAWGEAADDIVAAFTHGNRVL